MPFKIEKAARPNILSLEPYRCARDDFQEGILLDANENTYGPALDNMNDLESNLQLNRYPDPHQIALKQQICNFRNSESKAEGSELTYDQEDLKLTPENLCLGVGSDESIDALIRCFCQPSKEKMLVCPPTYGMYSICATVNDIELVKVPLSTETFEIQPDLINKAVADDSAIKLVYVTSPGNPTAKKIDFSLVEQVLSSPSFNGLFILDEAYIDFAPIGSSASVLVNKYPSLVILQTLSKSFGLAGIRLGITFANKQVSLLLNSLKFPYNISNLTSNVALRATTPECIAGMRKTCDTIKGERSWLLEKLLQLPRVRANRGGLDANFLLIEFVDAEGNLCNKVAQSVYHKLATEEKVVVRFRGKELGCLGCLRITVGTRQENEILVSNMRKVIEHL